MIARSVDDTDLYFLLTQLIVDDAGLKALKIYVSINLLAHKCVFFRDISINCIGYYRCRHSSSC